MFFVEAEHKAEILQYVADAKLKHYKQMLEVTDDMTKSAVKLLIENVEASTYCYVTMTLSTARGFSLMPRT